MHYHVLLFALRINPDQTGKKKKRPLGRQLAIIKPSVLRGLFTTTTKCNMKNAVCAQPFLFSTGTYEIKLGLDLRTCDKRASNLFLLVSISFLTTYNGKRSEMLNPVDILRGIRTGYLRNTRTENK